MNMKTLLLVASCALASASAAQAVTYSYVGSWAVADGPFWQTGPASLSGRQTAALLFGGVFSDYAISTIDSNPLNINFLAKLDGYGDTQYLVTPQGQDFVGIAGANYSSGFGNYSAYVFDHACGSFYCGPGGGESAINYAFRIDGAVPEPATWGLMIVGFGLVGGAMRRRAAVAA
jgi:hypothetical protein